MSIGNVSVRGVLIPGDSVTVDAVDQQCCVMEYSPQGVEVPSGSVYIEWEWECGVVVSLSEIRTVNLRPVRFHDGKFEAK